MQVLIPAAGMGKRLGAETSDKTKCMVKVNGKTLIEHCLDTVTSFKIDRIILIIGYEGDKLKKLLGNSYNGTKILYVENLKFASTNNIYSVYLAKKYLVQDDTILIESDLIFEKEVIKQTINNKFENIAVVDKFKPWMDGTVVKINPEYGIDHFISKSEFNYNDADTYFKTVNVYKFSKKFLKDIYVPFLEAYASALGNNEYYEQVLKVIVNLDMKQLKALPLSGELWYEIDDLQDLDNAEIIFAKPQKKFELLSRRYGGYWRYDNLIDFCYLVNPYFPSQKMSNEIHYSLDKLIQSYPSGEKVQALLAGKMFNVDPKNIVVGNGGAELISILTSSLKMKLAIFSPTFEEYTARFTNADVHIPSTKGFRYGKKDLLRIANNNDGIILVNPDNPSGNFIPYRDIIDILKTLKRENKYLVLDESFLDFADKGFESSALNTNDLENFNNLIIIKSIGKSYGIGGLRLGVMASANQKIMKKVKSDLPIWNINSVSEFYLQIIGKYSDDYIESCKKIGLRRLELFEGLSKIKYITPFQSQENYILMEIKGINATKIATDLCNKFGILVKDCSNKKSFGKSNCIRVAVRDTRDNEYLLDCLKTFEV